MASGWGGRLEFVQWQRHAMVPFFWLTSTLAEFRDQPTAA